MWCCSAVRSHVRGETSPKRDQHWWSTQLRRCMGAAASLLRLGTMFQGSIAEPGWKRRKVNARIPSLTSSFFGTATCVRVVHVQESSAATGIVRLYGRSAHNRPALSPLLLKIYAFARRHGPAE